VAGTTDAGPDGTSGHPGDIGPLARTVFEIVGRALAEGGFSMSDVVRTRMFLTDIARAPEVIEVHGEIFGSIRPAGAMVQVTALIDPSLLIEIVDAHR
jgi:enamine deaminase RidA (YjgF/YER057c/UK114 family)